MKTLVRATAAAALLTALAGCASTAGNSAASPVGNSDSTSASAPADSGASSSAPSAPEPTTPTPSAPASSAPVTVPAPPGGGDQVPLPPVSSTSANGDRIVYVSPDGVSVGADGRTLSTGVQWGGCQEQPQLVVFTQNAQKVVVEVKTVTHYRVGVMCPNIERTGTASVMLALPLNGRPVVDGITGRSLTR